MRSSRLGLMPENFSQIGTKLKKWWRNLKKAHRRIKQSINSIISIRFIDCLSHFLHIVLKPELKIHKIRQPPHMCCPPHMWCPSCGVLHMVSYMWCPPYSILHIILTIYEPLPLGYCYYVFLKDGPTLPFI